MALNQAAIVAQNSGQLSAVELLWGDCSPKACVSQKQLNELQKQLGNKVTVKYFFFNANLGSAKGHNTIARKNANEIFLILNPDVIMAPRVLAIMLKTFDDENVGVVEAKQIPIEHPKDFDFSTGETSWASTCCAMFRKKTFAAVDGFDHENFFLYCDDVDFSWRVRLLGLKVIFQPAAVVFHDKTLSDDGKWRTSAAERYYSAEAALLLAHKWSNFEYLSDVIRNFSASDDETVIRALNEYRRREETGRLPTPIDPENKVAQFIGGNYAKHRFVL